MGFSSSNAWLFCVTTIVVICRGGGVSTISQLTAMTFNAGLTTRIPFKQERTAYIKNNLASWGQDVMCLQEYWYMRDVKELVNQVQSQYPYSYSAKHNTNQELLQQPYSLPACPFFKTVYILWRMALEGCFIASSEIETIKCGVDKARVLDLPQDCLTCIAISGVTNMMSHCLLPSLASEMNVPGLLVLSKYPLVNTHREEYLPGVKQLLPRSYLYFEVENFGPFACTHATANLGPVYYEPRLLGTFTSWEEQNFFEVSKLVTTFHNFPEMVIMGDLNSGPAVPENQVLADFEDSYNHFTRNNYTTPYVTNVGRCTFCAENEIADYTENWILDHIFVKGLQTSNAQRVFDCDIPEIQAPPSDHYGVEVTISK